MRDGTSASTHVPADMLAASPCDGPEMALQAARIASVVMWQHALVGGLAQRGASHCSAAVSWDSHVVFMLARPKSNCAAWGCLAPSLVAVSQSLCSCTCAKSGNVAVLMLMLHARVGVKIASCHPQSLSL